MVKLAHAAEPQEVLPPVCTMDAKLCPDGSSVSRTGPDCAFAPCPGEAAAEEKKAGEDSLGDVFDELETDDLSDEYFSLDDDPDEEAPAGQAQKNFIDDPGKWASQRQEHQKYIESQPARWWENWQDKIDPEK